MRNAGLDQAQAGIKIARRNINNLRYADDTTLMAESEEELKSLLMKVKEESEKVDLKLNIEKTKIMASSPIASWQIDGEKVETGTDFRQCIKTKRCYFAYKVPQSQTYGFRCYCSVAKSFLTLSNPMDCSTPGFLVLHRLPEFAQTHVH